MKLVYKIHHFTDVHFCIVTEGFKYKACYIRDCQLNHCTLKCLQGILTLKLLST